MEAVQTAFMDSGLKRKVGLLRNLIPTSLEISHSIEDYVNCIGFTAQILNGIFCMNVSEKWVGNLLLMLAGLSDSYKAMIMRSECLVKI